MHESEILHGGMSLGKDPDLAHTCGRAPRTHTLVWLRLSCFLEFKANIYILRLLCIYAGLPAPLSIFGKLLLVSSC